MYRKKMKGFTEKTHLGRRVSWFYHPELSKDN